MIAKNTPAVEAAKLDESLFGVAWLPDAARGSAHWQEWTDMIRTIEDGDEGYEATVDDLPVVLEVYVALRRLGATFRPGVMQNLRRLMGAIVNTDADTDMDNDPDDSRDDETNHPKLVIQNGDVRPRRVSALHPAPAADMNRLGVKRGVA